jgi:Methylamine utilisation protein MauE
MAPVAHEFAAIASGGGRVCVGLVFLAAAVQKALHWPILPGVIANYPLSPRALVMPVAGVLPPLEMILGLALLSELARPWPQLAAILLLALFAAAMAVNLRRGRAHIDCGCGQSFLKQTLSWILVVRNAVLATLLLPSLAIDAPMTMFAALAGVGAGITFFLLYLLLNTISALPRPDARSHRFA